MSNITVPIISQIEALVKDVPGWTPIDQLYTLFNIAFVTASVEGDIVEIGSWCGRSTVVLGLAARLAGNSRIYCVDLFPAKNDWMANPDGTYSFEVVINGKRFGGHKENPVWKEPFEAQIGTIYEKNESVFDWFNETISSRGMQDIVHSHKGDLASLLDHLGPNLKCRLAFLDADHGFQAVSSDIRNADRCLVPGGWICFDDAFTVYEGVSRAISELILENPRYDRCQQMTRKLFVARKKANAD
jgi:predicted O-methyltransferase YrrM